MDKTAAESNLKAERHRNLKIWQEAMTLANEVYTITREMPRCSIAQMPRCCSRALNAAKRC